MQIPRAMLDLDTNEGLGSSDEASKHTPQRKRYTETASKISSYSPVLKGHKTDMPPELVVTSAQGSEKQHYPSTYDKLTELIKGHLHGEQSSFRKDDVLIYEKSKAYQSPIRNMDAIKDSELRLNLQSRISLRQSIWTIVPSEKVEVSWDSTNDSQEQLLRSCSEKLHEFKKIQKFKWWKKTKTEESEDVTTINRQKKKLKRRTSKVKKKEVNGIQDGKQNISLKIKALRMEESEKPYESDWAPSSKRTTAKNTGATRKFRKGGIVATAVQTRPHSAYVSADESTEKQENLNTKKKKKKRKLQSIQKQVKSVLCLVTSSKSDVKKKNK